MDWPVGDPQKEQAIEAAMEGFLFLPGPLLGRGSDRNTTLDIGPVYQNGTRITRRWAGNFARVLQNGRRGDVCGLLIPKGLEVSMKKVRRSGGALRLSSSPSDARSRLQRTDTGRASARFSQNNGTIVHCSGWYVVRSWYRIRSKAAVRYGYSNFRSRTRHIIIVSKYCGNCPVVGFPSVFYTVNQS